MPVGIPQFALVHEGLATGRRPLLDDGLDWLQAHGYRTVLHLHLPGEEITADQRQVEKRGLTYWHLEVSPASLSAALVERFFQLVQDKSRQPLFVYDRQGDLAGTLWYLYFRLAEHLPDDAARIRAAALGLRPEQDEAHRAMWLAAQRLLSERAR
jgi:protein tyrosine phosphatase (PTP) superfamily phosphohydrolase (DUF442 family)